MFLMFHTCREIEILFVVYHQHEGQAFQIFSQRIRIFLLEGFEGFLSVRREDL